MQFSHPALCPQTSMHEYTMSIVVGGPAMAMDRPAIVGPIGPDIVGPIGPAME